LATYTTVQQSNHPAPAVRVRVQVINTSYDHEL